MRFGWAQALNRWIGDHIVAAGASPNDADDPTGAINRLFRHVHYIGQKRRQFKRWNGTVYRLTKLALIAAVVGMVVLL
jgi:beta-hydroxylase